MNIAVICAGGNGHRMMTKENKIFLTIDNKPIIYYALKTFSEYDKVDGIIVTVGSENIRRLEELIDKYKIEKVISVEEAYSTRQESTYHVIEKLKKLNLPHDSYLLIHNAVNLLVRHAELDECLAAAHRYGASLLGFEATDTVKIVKDHDNIIDHTPDRASLWIAQTPQIIRFDIAIKAFEVASNRGVVATDDTTLVEEIHEQVKFVPCSRENFKITYPQDLDLAGRIMTSRVKEKNCWYA
jgi:2-C-methyl-D-erythritol 4-phosphate cytidylyltransferase